MIPTASPRYLLDSGIIIRYLRADPRAPALLDQLAQLGEVSTSAVTVFEIFRGCRSSQEEAAASELFTLVPAVALDRPAAETGGRISRDHAGIFSSERAAPDALIAGTALNGQAVLVTLNTRQFSRLRIAGLEVLAIDQTASDWVSAVRKQP